MNLAIFKKIILGVILFSSIPTISFAQDSQETLNTKYWTMRERFRKYFINIGKDEGQSIPAAKRQDQSLGGNRCNGLYPGSTGWMSWGDATGYLGDYMCMLATEYALLAQEGRSTTATLNELYYAINAIDRLDGVAENTFDISKPIDYNGFFLRDDVTDATMTRWNNEYIATDSKDSKLNYQCLNSDRRDNLDGEVRGNVSTNEVSLDQIATIFQGFSFIKKYVPNIYVKPTAQDAGFNLIDKMKQITSNIMEYMSGADKTLLRADHSSEFLYSQLNPASYFFGSPGLGGTVTLISDCANNDVRGNWILMNPVTNRKVGASSNDTKNQDIRPFAWVLARIGEQLTGNTYADRDIHHKIVDQAGDGYYCLDVHDFHIPLTWIKSHVWDAIEQLPAIHDEFTILYPELSFQKKPLCFKINDGAVTMPISALARNLYLIEALAAMSGSWSHTNVMKFANQYDHENIDLVYSCLNNASPKKSKQHYIDLLSKMSCNGPHNYGTGDYTPFWNNGNSFEHPNPNNIISGDTYYYGDYNANDWMWLYNMYRLKFGDNTFPGYDDNSCNCKKSPVIEQNVNNTTMELTNSITVKRLFKDYLKLGISLKEYTTGILFINNKILENESELVVCQGDVHVLNGGILKNNTSLVNDSVKIIVNANASISVETNGKLEVGTNTKVVIRKSGNLYLSGSNAQIVVKNGGKLIIEGGANFYIENSGKLLVEDGGLVIINGVPNPGGATGNYGKLTFNQGGIIQLQGNNAVLDIKGDLHIGDNATFTFIYTGINSGYVRFSRPYYYNSPQISCGVNSKFKLKGALPKTDKILEIAEIDLFMPGNLAECEINFGKVEFATPDSRLPISNHNVRLMNTKFIATFPNSKLSSPTGSRGLLLYGQQNVVINTCQFEKFATAINAVLLWGGAPLTINSTIFNDNSGSLITNGAGVTLNNCTFTNGGGYTGNSMYLNSSINGCNFANTSSGVDCYSQADVTLKDNYITGLQGTGGNYYLRCNRMASVIMNDNTSLNMSTLVNDMGYNDLSNVNAGFGYPSIMFYNGTSWDPNYGYNTFINYDTSPCTTQVISYPPHMSYNQRYCPTLTEGNLTNPQQDANGYYVQATANYWKPQSGTLHTEYNKLFYNWTSASYPYNHSDTIRVRDNAQLTGIMECPPNPIEPPLEHFSASFPNSSLINTTSFQNKALSDALESVMVSLDTATVDKTYETSLNQLTEINTYSYNNLNSSDKKLLEMAYKKQIGASSVLTSSKRKEIDSLGVNNVGINQQLSGIKNVIETRKNYYNSNNTHLKELNRIHVMSEYAILQGTFNNHQRGISIIDSLLTIDSIPLSTKSYLKHWHCTLDAEGKLKNGELAPENFHSYLSECNPSQNKNARLARTENYTESPVTIISSEKYAALVFPNPAKTELTVLYDLGQAIECSFDIYDINGKKLIHKELNPKEHEQKIDNLDLPNGVYLYSIHADGQIIATKKLIVIN